VNSCCEKPELRTPPEDAGPGKTVTYCTVCGRRHVELAVAPIEIGLKGA
jgi:hypothetical protein